MKRLRLLSLLLVIFLLTGCLWVRPNNGLTTVEVKGELGLAGELWLTREGSTFMVDLGQDKVRVLPLEPGLWSIQAYSRDAKGNVVSLSEPTKVQGKHEAAVSLVLSKTEAKTTEIRATNVIYSLSLSGGAELHWEGYLSSETLEAGSWEVWKRHQDSFFWQKTKELPQGVTSFVDSEVRAHEYLYAVRFVAPPEAGLLFPSPLMESQGPKTGVLDVTWSFDHYFAPVSQRLSASALDVTGDSDPDPTFIDLIAHFRTKSDFAQRAQLLASLGLTMKREIPSLLAALVEPHPGSELSLEEWSTYQDDNLFLEPNWILEAGALDRVASNLPWYLEYLRIPGAHEETTGSHSVRIAVVDSGLNEDQLPASVRVLPGYNFVARSGDTRDDYEGVYHGTKVSRTISEAMPVVSLQPVKVLGAGGSGTAVDVSEGMLYAAGLHDSVVNPTPAHIMNLSLGQLSESSALRKAVERIANETDMLMVAAAGNTQSGVRGPGLYYPAALAQVLAVGTASPGLDGPWRAYYSHYGHALDVVAPPSFAEGTSFSTALVSGVAGLMLSQGIDLRDIRSILTTTAMDIGLPGWDEEHGYGLVHAQWAAKDIRSLRLEVKDASGESLQEEVPLKGATKRFYLPPGEYTVEAWVNVQGGAFPQVGDYLGYAERIMVHESGEVDVSVTLSEKGN